ncbi:hypothetical protein QTP88_028602 [Uroleucon formosanum]
MSSEEDVVCALALLYAYKNHTKARKKKWWVRPSLQSRKVANGSKLLNELREDDELNFELRGSFHNFLRMSSSDFENILCKIEPIIKKSDTFMRQAIPVQERLAVTLRFLATGDSYMSLSYLFKISKQSISEIIPEVCTAIIDVLKEFIKRPNTVEEWLDIANGFETRWNVPNCIGSWDGKHIALQSPMSSGTEYYNYKGFFSIVLMAASDSNYNVIWANVGSQGRISDGGVFDNMKFKHLMTSGQLKLPDSRPLRGRSTPIPYVFIADDAFPISHNIMKPYSGHHEKGSKERICNYRFSRGRRVVENLFGILASVFRIFRKPMLVEPNKAEIITLACLHLHNYLRKSPSSQQSYWQPGTVDYENVDTGEITRGTWRNDQVGLNSFMGFDTKTVILF